MFRDSSTCNTGSSSKWNKRGVRSHFRGDGGRFLPIVAVVAFARLARPLLHTVAHPAFHDRLAGGFDWGLVIVTLADDTVCAMQNGATAVPLMAFGLHTEWTASSSVVSGLLVPCPRGHRIPSRLGWTSRGTHAATTAGCLVALAISTSVGQRSPPSSIGIAHPSTPRQIDAGLFVHRGRKSNRNCHQILRHFLHDA